MIEKNIDYGEDSRYKLQQGVNKLADAVRSTLGAAGNTVITEDDFGRPHITKDGVTVAKTVNLTDPVEHLGASIVKQASIKTAEDAGDGTTTSIVITQDVIEKAGIAGSHDVTFVCMGCYTWAFPRRRPLTGALSERDSDTSGC